ncbi:MAG TPA: AgmX/PglI C-terminal domain-containing protein [Polyangiaceae bacterium]
MIELRKAVRWLMAVGMCLPIGCTFYARSATQYRDDTAKLLSSKQTELDNCYDTAVKTAPTAAGKVTLQFNVEEKTGKLTDVKADPARTTAPQPLIDCVVNAVNGLVLDPPDQRKGIATFEYDFARQAAVATPSTPAAPAGG